jgi:hypothetical protein
MSLTKTFFRCSQCEQCFHSAKELSSHKERNHIVSQERFSCALCRAEVTNINDLTLHVRKHLIGKLKCPICEQTFAKQFNLERHFSLKHCKIDKIQCQKCNTTFGRKDHMKDHQKFCGNDNPVKCKCSFCGKGFLKKSNCKRHEMFAHNGCNSNETVSVNKKYGESSEKIDPKESRKGKTFECKKCGRKFKGTFSYDEHKRVCKTETRNERKSHESRKRPMTDDSTETERKRPNHTKIVNCRTCGTQLQNYKELYRHKLKVLFIVRK